MTRREIEDARDHLKAWFPNQSVERHTFNKLCDQAVRSLRSASGHRATAEEWGSHRSTPDSRARTPITQAVWAEYVRRACSGAENPAYTLYEPMEWLELHATLPEAPQPDPCSIEGLIAGNRTAPQPALYEFVRICVLGRGDVPMDIRKGAQKLLDAAPQRSSIPCARCGDSCVEFTVPNEVWNAVVRRGGKEGADEYICEACYRLAVEAFVRSETPAGGTAKVPAWVLDWTPQMMQAVEDYYAKWQRIQGIHDPDRVKADSWSAMHAARAAFAAAPSPDGNEPKHG
jgi:hypothetical protein